jgi:hypothetical protein
MNTANPSLSRLAKTLVAGLAFALVGPVLAQTATPKDPKSPVSGFADGRGPTGPVTLKIVSPTAGEVVPVPQPEAGQPPAKGAPVTLKVELANFETFQDEGTKSGQHLEILVDNISTLFPWNDSTKPYTFKSLPRGTHTVRIFPVRPWGEAIKESSAFAMVTFHVGEKDGKNTIEPGSPVLTIASPRGKVKGTAGKVLLDVLVTGCPVAEKAVPDSCRLRYKVDTEKEVTLTKIEPVWLEKLAPGRHAYVVGLTRDEKVVPGAFALYQGSFEIENGANPAAPGSAPPSSATGH